MTELPALGPLRYDLDAILKDGAFGALGVLVVGWIGSHVITLESSNSDILSLGVIGITVCLIACCYLLGVATYRAFVRVTTTPEAITHHGPHHWSTPKTIQWSAIETLSLRYFSTRRDRSGGWHQLTLQSAGKTIKVTSDLAMFDQIVVRAHRSAHIIGTPMDAATRANLQVFGLVTSGQSAASRVFGT